jgi:hypothetical protein
MTIIERVAAALAECPDLPGPLDGQDDDMAEAMVLVVEWMGPTGNYLAWNARAERDALDRMEKAARELARAFASLHPSIRYAVSLEGMKISAADLSSYYTTAPLPALDHVQAIPEMLAKARPGVERAIAKGAPHNGASWKEAALVQPCRDLWARRRGEKAPRSHKDVRFAAFFAAVLTAFGSTRDVESVFKAWKRAEDKQIKPVPSYTRCGG